MCPSASFFLSFFLFLPPQSFKLKKKKPFVWTEESKGGKKSRATRHSLTEPANQRVFFHNSLHFFAFFLSAERRDVGVGVEAHVEGRKKIVHGGLQECVDL